MKKSLIALAVLAAASGAAMAQSSVTLFGVVDATIRYIDADTTGIASGWCVLVKAVPVEPDQFRLQQQPHRLPRHRRPRWRPECQLLARSRREQRQRHWLRHQPNNSRRHGAAPAGSQGLTFNRRSTVSLAGSWGEVRLGRDYVPYFWNTTIFDPFGTNGVGAVSNFTLKGLNVITGGQV